MDDKDEREGRGQRRFSNNLLKAKKAEKSEKLVEMFCSSQLRSPADEWTVEDEETLRKLQDTDNIQLAKTEVKR